MLEKKLRITKKKEFERILTKGKSHYSHDLGVKSISNGLTFNRIGLIVSNKVSKSAVVRNRIRRRLREQLAALLPEIKIGYDIVVIAQVGIINLRSHDMKQELADTLKRLRLFA